MHFKSPDPTPEDPAIAAARQREQTRADAAFVTNTQGLLDDQDRKRARRFGTRVALTGANPAAPAPAGPIPLLPPGGY